MIRVALLLLLSFSPAWTADKEMASLLSTFKREAIREPIVPKILRLTPPDSPVRPAFVVPVKDTKVTPPVLRLYLYKGGDRPKLLADPRGQGQDTLVFDTLKSLTLKDDDQDGLMDISLIAAFRAEGQVVEKAAEYRNEGSKGYRLAGTPPVPKGPKTGFPLPLDCKFAGLDGGWWAAACPEEGKPPKVRLRLDGEVRLEFETPGATEITVEGQDSRAVAIGYDGPQCRVVKVIRLKDGGLAADTDCTPSTYCALARFPKGQECNGAVECGGGAGGFRWKREFDLCK